MSRPQERSGHHEAQQLAMQMDAGHETCPEAPEVSPAGRTARGPVLAACFRIMTFLITRHSLFLRSRTALSRPGGRRHIGHLPGVLSHWPDGSPPMSPALSAAVTAPEPARRPGMGSSSWSASTSGTSAASTGLISTLLPAGGKARPCRNRAPLPVGSSSARNQGFEPRPRGAWSRCSPAELIAHSAPGRTRTCKPPGS